MVDLSGWRMAQSTWEQLDYCDACNRKATWEHDDGGRLCGPHFDQRHQPAWYAFTRLQRVERRILRQAAVLARRQRNGDMSRALIDASNRLIAEREALLPQLRAARQAAYDEWRRW